jgi:LmbE family N-acetylglucosaminyl deacetylase
VKSLLREQEQRDSARFFGLPDECLSFLRAAEDGKGDPIDSSDNLEKVRSCLAAARPDLVFLPHGNDSNAGHRFTFEMLRQAASSSGPAAALLNRDPKTLAMRSDLLMFFDEELAAWKAAMLRFHRSQHRRNLNHRGYGLDERILRVNREAAARFPGHGPYAEEFEVWLPQPTA